MLNVAAMLAWLDARPFGPFRFHMSDGGTVDVPSREMVIPGKTFAVVGLVEQEKSPRVATRWTTVWYMHVGRIEMLTPGAPPFTLPSPSGTEIPSPAA
jgi:hypothetical protein